MNQLSFTMEIRLHLEEWRAIEGLMNMYPWSKSKAIEECIKRAGPYLASDEAYQEKWRPKKHE